MKNLTDRDYLLGQQYRNASNLRTRIALHQRFSTNPEGSFPRWFMRQLDIPDGGRVLEVGAGPGGYWPEVIDLIDDSWDITVTDLSNGMVDQARERLERLGRPLAVLQADVQTLPFDERSFDVVLANFMLYHVPDRQRALSEIHRVLRPGGKFYAMTNGRNHMRELNQLVESVAPGAVREEESGFSLENGADQLDPWFDDVRLTRYPDSLHVTEVEPLVTYVRSYAPLSAEQESALRNRIEDVLAQRGAVEITKDPGLFSAK